MTLGGRALPFTFLDSTRVMAGKPRVPSLEPQLTAGRDAENSATLLTAFRRWRSIANVESPGVLHRRRKISSRDRSVRSGLDDRSPS